MLSGFFIKACQNPIAAGDFQWILTRNCEGTEQLRVFVNYAILKYKVFLLCNASET